MLKEDIYRNPYLEVFRKEDDLIFKLIPIPGLLMVEFRRIFERPDGDQMCNVYPVSDRHVESLQKFTTELIDLGKYDYFVSAPAEKRRQIEP